MAAPESSRKRSYNTDEVVFAILADDDSDNETFEEESVDETHLLQKTIKIKFQLQLQLQLEEHQ